MPEDEADELDRLDEAARKKDRVRGLYQRFAQRPSAPAIGPLPPWTIIRGTRRRRRSVLQRLQLS